MATPKKIKGIRRLSRYFFQVGDLEKNGMFNKQKLILVTTKYLSYLINILIVSAVVGGAAAWVYMLYLSAQ